MKGSACASSQCGRAPPSPTRAAGAMLHVATSFLRDDDDDDDDDDDRATSSSGDGASSLGSSLLRFATATASTSSSEGRARTLRAGGVRVRGEDSKRDGAAGQRASLATRGWHLVVAALGLEKDAETETETDDGATAAETAKEEWEEDDDDDDDETESTNDSFKTCEAAAPTLRRVRALEASVASVDRRLRALEERRDDARESRGATRASVATRSLSARGGAFERAPPPRPRRETHSTLSLWTSRIASHVESDTPRESPVARLAEAARWSAARRSWTTPPRARRREEEEEASPDATPFFDLDAAAADQRWPYAPSSMYTESPPSMVDEDEDDEDEDEDEDVVEKASPARSSPSDPSGAHRERACRLLHHATFVEKNDDDDDDVRLLPLTLAPPPMARATMSMRWLLDEIEDVRREIEALKRDPFLCA